jgi:hypothetical protein
VFCLIAATAGFGGGNFASSMANINFFYPAAKKGAALGLNAAGGNAGVAVIQLLLPVIIGGAGIFGLVKASEGGLHLQTAGYVYAGLAVLAVPARPGALRRPLPPGVGPGRCRRRRGRDAPRRRGPRRVPRRCAPGGSALGVRPHVTRC